MWLIIGEKLGIILQPWLNTTKLLWWYYDLKTEYPLENSLHPSWDQNDVSLQSVALYPFRDL